MKVPKFYAEKHLVQAKMLEVLSENEYVSLADLQKFTNGSHSTVKALEKKNLVNVFDMTVDVIRIGTEFLRKQKRWFRHRNRNTR